MTCTIFVAGACTRPMILARSSSSEGSVASAFTPFTSRSVSPIAPPTSSNLSFVFANSTATLAAATGSVDVAKPVGPVSISLSAAYGVPSIASLASLFFVTLKLAPASRIFVRRSVVCATVNPRLRATTTTPTVARLAFRLVTRSDFSVRSMPFSCVQTRRHDASVEPHRIAGLASRYGPPEGSGYPTRLLLRGKNCSPSRLDIKKAEIPSPTVSDGPFGIAAIRVCLAN